MARIPLPRNLTPHARNIVNVFYDATDAELSYGQDWYAIAYRTACELSPDAPEIGAGVLAALSPQTGWTQNVDLARRAFTQGAATHTTYERARKADRIMSCAYAPLDVLGGNKVRAFYRAIMGDPTAVVIDRHAFDIAIGRPTDDDARKVLARVGTYDRFARSYVLAARMIARETHGAITLTPAQLQAITWVVWRRQNDLDDRGVRVGVGSKLKRRAMGLAA